ncbi:beta-glucosidase [Hydrogenispora ethanolica]|uniref:Beta-glucosidase n=1 Tax=Hydrogenispora ethanolica TaxID=1082276 RepID=A0A4R1R9J0_HYDET|nr:glycoside hydrolase family 3 C-terminal domain-containing protein [Hydrogenispora ethanolica]TCL62384.1 beta-glucosidase [Hydrogenispora ethanolica]
MELKEIIAKLSLEEKFAILTGLDNWRTVPVERLGIPSVVMSDGPHGLRKVVKDETGAETTLQAVCFPTSAAMSATWNPELVRQVGQALGEECGAMGVDILLGPGTNIKRTPLCGRNFEYYSEDPLLAGELAAAYIDGVQSQGVGTSLKHFATNNQEFDRFQISSEVDIRTLREIYFKPFEIAVKRSQPWTVMCAYNRLNGIYCSENRFLLDELLRREWGFEGIVVSDWWAVHDRAKSLGASLELEMPFTPDSAANLREAYEKGAISDATIDEALERLLKLIFRAAGTREGRAKQYDLQRHHALAKAGAIEAITLLKNEDDLLPIRRDRAQKVVIIGGLAEKPAFEGGGSSYVNPLLVDIPLEQIKALAGDAVEINYFPVLSAANYQVNQLNLAMAAARKADLAIVFAGNRNGAEFRGRDGIESEEYDRNYLTLSPETEMVIQRIASQNPNTAVIVQAGAAVDMSAWIHPVKAVLFAWYTGQAAGSALAEILFGVANPSGKIAETFPLRIEDTPAYATYPGNGSASWYAEGLMVGYRYYDTYQKEVLFPFGHGLSYTTFGYSALEIAPSTAAERDTVTVSCKVKNSGGRKGKETVQLYVRDVASKVLRPDKELKAFAKIELEPGAEQTVNFELKRDAFAYYNTSLHDWHVESGEFEILIGASSRDIRLAGSVSIEAEQDFS